jgi:hypothetical protein
MVKSNDEANIIGRRIKRFILIKNRAVELIKDPEKIQFFHPGPDQPVAQPG